MDPPHLPSAAGVREPGEDGEEDLWDEAERLRAEVLALGEAKDSVDANNVKLEAHNEELAADLKELERRFAKVKRMITPVLCRD
jgi:chromosome segregation ATPase